MYFRRKYVQSREIIKKYSISGDFFLNSKLRIISIEQFLHGITIGETKLKTFFMKKYTRSRKLGKVFNKRRIRRRVFLSSHGW